MPVAFLNYFKTFYKILNFELKPIYIYITLSSYSVMYILSIKVASWNVIPSLAQDIIYAYKYSWGLVIIITQLNKYFLNITRHKKSRKSSRLQLTSKAITKTTRPRNPPRIWLAGVALLVCFWLLWLVHCCGRLWVSTFFFSRTTSETKWLKRRSSKLLEFFRKFSLRLWTLACYVSVYSCCTKSSAETSLQTLARLKSRCLN